MSSLLSAEGMFHGHRNLSIEQVFDHAGLDADGRILLPIVDVLAILRIDADAQLLMVNYAGGASCVLRLSDTVTSDDLFLRFQLDGRSDAADALWTARLWSGV
jgi:hypothetical protein